MVDFTEVVIPVDGSDNALRAARFGARLAHAVGSPCRLLHVFRIGGDEVMGMASLSKAQIEEATRRSARRIFDTVLSEIGNEGPPPEELILHGDPAEEILGYLEAHPQALVVMGRRGKGRLEALMVGSVADKVLRHSRGAITLVG
ncbi:MAG TPA: universal stress protein [Pseudomonadales bacterium]